MTYLQHLDNQERENKERIQKLIELVEDAIFKLRQLKKEINVN